MRKLKLIPEVEKMVRRSFEDKYIETCLVIQKRLSILNRNIAIAFSGGKDSQVTLHIVLSVYPDIPVIFNNTGVEYPETIKFVHDLANAWNLNLIETKPEKTFWQCVNDYGFPHNKRGSKGKPGSRNCCYWCKDKPMLKTLKSLHLDGYFTGITAVENRTRMFTARDYGTCYKTVSENIWKIHPILWWTEDEVWSYLTERGLNANPIYSKGAARVGCMPCTAFSDWEKQLSQTNPKMYSVVKRLKDNQAVMVEMLSTKLSEV